MGFDLMGVRVGYVGLWVWVVVVSVGVGYRGVAVVV